MNLSPEFLNRASAETGFSQSTLEKAIRLGDLATNISRHPLLGNVLALKGGTALNLCFGPPKRLSVDLDFNYIGHADRDAMLAHRPEAHEAVLQLVGRMGYQTQESSKGFAGGKIFLGYRSASGNRDRIELDLNYLYRIPWSGTSTRLLWQPDGLDPALIRVVGLPELLIGKLLAFLDRMAARDVWDVANLPAEANEALALPSFRKELIAFSAILVHPLGSYTRERFDRSVTEQAISDQVMPMLTGEARVHRSDLVTRAWDVIVPFLRLEPVEKQYVEGIALGEVRTALLFPDDLAKATQIATHPAIEWKLKNVVKHRPKRA